MTKRILLVAALLIASAIAPGALAAGAISDHDEPAELHIEQPHYVSDDVVVDTSGNHTTYEVSGGEHLIVPNNFDQDALIDYGVEEEQGDLTINQDLDQLVFTAEADGTYHLYFVVEEEQTREVEVEPDDEGGETDDSDADPQGEDAEDTAPETETETYTTQQRYVAQIQASDVNQELIGAGEREELRQDAANWQEWEESVKDVAGADANIEHQSQVALTLLNVRNNPTILITGEFWYFGFLLFGTISGLTYVAIWLFWDWFKSREQRKKINEIESMEPEEADLDEKLHEHDRQERTKALVNTNAHDWCDDEYAARGIIESFGKDNLSAWMNFSKTISGESMMHDRLLAIGKDGHKAAVRRDDGGEIVDGRVIRPDTDEEHLGDGVEVVEISEHVDRLAQVVDPRDDVLFEWDLSESGVQLRDVGETLDSPETIDELQERLDADLRRFQGDEEAYTKYLQEMVEHVREHPFTDADGEPKLGRYAISNFLKHAQTARDMWDMPLAQYQVEYLETLLKEHDPVEDAEIMIERDARGEDIRAD